MWFGGALIAKASRQTTHISGQGEVLMTWHVVGQHDTATCLQYIGTVSTCSAIVMRHQDEGHDDNDFQPPTKIRRLGSKKQVTGN